MSGTSTGKSRDLPKDFDKIFDKRLKSFRFTAIPPKLEEWKGTSIVTKVFDNEINVRNFKSTEERIIYRMELWIDTCRIETYLNGTLTNGVGKFHSAKRFRKPSEASSNKLLKVRSFSMGRATSKSMESLDQPILREPNRMRPATSTEFVHAVETSTNTTRMAPAKSTGDLLILDRQKKEDSAGYIDLRSRNTDRDIEQTFDKFGTNPKRKLKFFLFRRKSDKVDKKSNDSQSEARRNSSSKKNKNSKDSKSKNSESKHHREPQPPLPQEKEYGNNNQSSSLTKLRPSVFDMESLKTGIPDLHNKKTYGYEYDPSKRNTNGARANNNRFNTIVTPGNYRKQQQQQYYQSQPQQHRQHYQQQCQQQETLFKTSNHNDSVKRQKVKSRNIPESTFYEGPVFFDPDKQHIKRRGTAVRTELGQI